MCHSIYVNMKFNKKLFIPYIVAVTVYLLSYEIPKFIVKEEDLHFLILPIDNKIPFYSWTILIYTGAFLQWINAILIGMKQDTKKGYKFASAIIIGSLIGFLTFIIYPTGITRPVIKYHNIFDYLMKFIFTVDSVSNACPSFHCFCSTIVILMLIECKDVSKKTIIFNSIFSIMVYASTLFTKQHYIIDIPFGILLAYIAFIISSKINFESLFEKINKKVDKY